MKKNLLSFLLMTICGMTAWAQSQVSTADQLVDAIAAGGDIQLTADIALPSVVTVSKDVVLDLNGKTLTLECDNGLTIQNGSLDLTGTGTVSSADDYPLYVVGSKTDVANYSTLKVGSNVTVNTTGDYAIGVFSESSSTKGAYGVNMEVKGTLVSNKGVYVSSYIKATTGNVPVLHFDGATINSTTQGMLLAGYAKTTLANTNITVSSTSSTRIVFITAGEFTLNSGMLQGDYSYGVFMSQSGSAPATATITGGTIKSGSASLYKSSGTISVSGGLFSSQVPADYCAPGYSPTTTKDAQGYYTVSLPGYDLTVYAGTSSSEAKNLTPTAWEKILATTPNAVAIIDYSADNQAFAKSTKNVIVKKELGSTGIYSYTCPNFVLTDLCNWGNKNASTAAATNFYCPVNFTATTGSYKRTLRGDYNSACVPFAITEGMFGDKELLAYTSYNEEDNNAMFTYQTAASAGVAVIINPSVATEWTVDFSSTKILGSPVKGTAFTGVFQTTGAYQGMYSVNTSLEKKFSPLANNLYPFRSCFSLSGDAANKAREFVNFVIMDETTGINEVKNGSNSSSSSNGSIYNLAGQRVNANAKGLFIQNGKVVVK